MMAGTRDEGTTGLLLSDLPAPAAVAAETAEAPRRAGEVEGRADAAARCRPARRPDRGRSPACPSRPALRLSRTGTARGPGPARRPGPRPVRRPADRRLPHRAGRAERPPGQPALPGPGGLRRAGAHRGDPGPGPRRRRPLRGYPR